MLTKIIRWILSTLLLYGAYTETGFWTTVALTLIILRCELEDITTARLLKHSSELGKRPLDNRAGGFDS